MTALALTLLAGSILSIAAVQLCSPWLRRRAGPRIAYACWLLPWLGVIVCMLPPDATAAIFAPPEGLTGILSARVAALAGSIAGSAACRLALLTWAVVAILFLATHLAAYQAFLRHSGHRAVECGRAGAVRIFIGPNVPTPVAAGILRRRIFLPARFDTVFSPDEQRMILRHERTHHDRHDIAANLAGLLMLSLHWWNPLAYRAHRRFRADQELACDATAIAGLGRRDRHAYATAILKCAGRPNRGLAAAMSGRTEAAMRVSAIASDAPPTHAPALPAMLAFALLGSLVLFEGAATRAISFAPTRVAAGPRSPAPAFAPSDSPGADICEHAWRPTPDTPQLTGYHPTGAPGVRLIVARLETGRIDRGPPRAV